jgi:hypothetical protein
MPLTLTDYEADLLHGLLSDCLPGLRQEIARTERHDLRHMLIEREELAERLLAQLARPTAPG